MVGANASYNNNNHRRRRASYHKHEANALNGHDGPIFQAGNMRHSKDVPEIDRSQKRRRSVPEEQNSLIGMRVETYWS